MGTSRDWFQTRCASSILVLASLVLLTSCGGGGGGGGHSNGTAPTISGLTFGPAAVYVNSGGGTEVVGGDFNFADPDGDLQSLTLAVADFSGKIIDTISAPISGAAGMKSGTITGQVSVDTSTAGTYTIHVSVTDKRGLKSNELTSAFRISEFPWVVKQPMPAPRRDFATAMLNGRVYVLGGGDTQAPVIPSPATSTVQVYDPATDAWTSAASMPVAVRNHAAATVDGKIYVVGGESDVAPGLKTLQVYDPGTGLWTLGADMPTELRDHAATGAGGQLYVFGGNNAGMDTAASLSYDIATDKWTSRATMPRAGRDMAATTVNDKPFVLGGYGGTWIPDAGYYRLMQQYDPAADTWTARADMPVPRSDFAVAALNGIIFVAGGGNWDRALTDVYAYDASADAWTGKESMPTGLAWPRAETVNGKMYVFDGGTTFEYTPSNDIR